MNATRLLRSFSYLTADQHVKSAFKESRRIQEALQKVQVIRTAEDYLRQGSFRLARDLFKTTKILEPSDVEEIKRNIYIDEKLVEVENGLQNFRAAETILDSVIQNSRKVYPGDD